MTEARHSVGRSVPAVSSVAGVVASTAGVAGSGAGDAQAASNMVSSTVKSRVVIRFGFLKCNFSELLASKIFRGCEGRPAMNGRGYETTPPKAG